MRLLLDTDALIWLLDRVDGGSLGIKARESLKSAEVVYVSPISVVEIRIKSMLEKMTSPSDLLDDIAKAGCEFLPYSALHADAIVQFPSLKRHDPFDRMLVAQAYSEGIQFMTSDAVLLGLGHSFIVDATE